MSKVTLHCQNVPGWAGEFLARAGCGWVKGIGNYLAFPNCKTIGRVYYDQGQVDARVREGAAGADAMFTAVWPEVEKNPQVYAWETPANEPSIWDLQVLAGLVPFCRRLTYRFHAAGRRIVVGAINTGWPRLPGEDGGAQMRALALACVGADGISFHEYDPADMRANAGSLCLRYRHFHEFCVAEGYPHPPVFITECGLDRPGPGCPDFGHCGWKTILGGDVPAYVEQLAWYESELRRDDYVECATIFTAGPSGWWDFEVTQDLATALAGAMNELEPGPEPSPEPGGEMDILIFDSLGNEQTETWLHDKWGNVTWTADPTARYGTLVLTEDESGSSTTVVGLYDADNIPLAGQEVHCLNGGDTLGTTDAVGEVGFGWGGGSYYEHGGTGPMTIRTGGVTVAGLGWLRYADGSFSNHYHLNLELREGGDMPTDERARGFYVSTWQGHIDGATWQAIKDAGYSYVHIRASHGLEADPYFAANWDGAGQVGLLRSAWHYLVPDVSSQAAFFLNVVGDRVPELGFYGDFEERDLTVDKCNSFLWAMESHGIYCHVYTSAGWLNPRGEPDWGDRYLWVANWTDAAEPLLPHVWDAWEFWQYTDGVYDEVIKATVCYDRFNGTVADLRAKYAPEPPPDDDDEVRALILEARAKLAEADDLLVQALALL